MPVNPSQIVKSLEIPITKRGEDGAEVSDVLRPKYKPITQSWLDKWEEVRRNEFIAGQAFLELAGQAAEARAALEQATNEHRDELSEKVEEAEGKLKAHAEANPAPEFDFLSRQMADLLLSVDYEGEPQPLMPAYLATFVDRELLVEIKERIEKKLSRR